MADNAITNPNIWTGQGASLTAVYSGWTGSADDYVVSRIQAAYAFINDPNRDDTTYGLSVALPPVNKPLNDNDLGYWRGHVEEITKGNGIWSGYWWDRIVNTPGSPGNPNGISATGGTPGSSGSSSTSSVGGLTGQKGGGANGALVNPQLGILEDDIIYRLSLLVANVLQPLKNQFPGIIVVSGFRQMNTGIGQHELGEAVDIQIQNQTDAQLYTVADYIQKFLNFDQLVLNWTDIGNKKGWIHVSFSPNSLRGQVLTKDLADSFHEGLFLVTPLSGEAAAQAQRDQDASDAKILSELQNIQSRQERLGNSPFANSESSSTTSTAGPPLDAAHIKLIQCVISALALPVNLQNAFEITRRVAWQLRGEKAGLLIKDPSSDVAVGFGDYTVSAVHIVYPNGQTYVVIDPGTFGATGSNDGFVDPGRYLPASDPGGGINGNWLSCSL